MGCFHFVIHAYGSWHPDKAEGWHQHGGEGTIKPSEAIGEYRRFLQKWGEARFEEGMWKGLLNIVIDACGRRGWRLHAAAVNWTHVHAVVGWEGEVEWEFVQATLKRLIGWRAAKMAGTEGVPWVSDGGKPRQVRDEEHLRELVWDYLAKQGGGYWREGMEVPGWS